MSSAAEQDGFAPRQFANPDCIHCKGTGYADRGRGLLNPICTCVLLRRDMEAADKRIELSFPPSARQMTFKRYDTGDRPANELALHVCRRFVDLLPEAREEGWILGIYGEPGAGKTHLAYAIAQAAIKRYFITATAMNVPEMLRQVRAGFNQARGEATGDPIQKAIDCDLLILDDLGAEYEKEGAGGVSWVEEQLYVILDQRIMDLKPIVYTTNVAPNLMKERFGGDSTTNRIFSRIERKQVDLLQLQRVVERSIPGDDTRRRLRG